MFSSDECIVCMDTEPCAVFAGFYPELYWLARYNKKVDTLEQIIGNKRR